jgi:FMN reductase
MSKKLVLGVSGNLTRPSKTRSFVDHIAGQVAKNIGASSTTFDIEDLGPSFAQARRIGDLDPSVRNIVELLADATVLVVGSPTYKGSYTGLFKHFFDLLDPSSLKGKPVILAATGGGERHSLIVEHQLRPLRFLRSAHCPHRDLRFGEGLRQRRPCIRSDPRSRATSRRRSMPGGWWRGQRQPCRLKQLHPVHLFRSAFVT